MVLAGEQVTLSMLLQVDDKTCALETVHICRCGVMCHLVWRMEGGEVYTSGLFGG